MINQCAETEWYGWQDFERAEEVENVTKMLEKAETWTSPHQSLISLATDELIISQLVFDLWDWN